MCAVYLEKPAYYPGDTVLGQVYMNLVNDQNIRRIIINVQGMERVRIGNNETAIRSDNKLMSRNFTIASPGHLQAGVHQFPFSFTIPYEVLPSYRGRYSSVYFRVQATYDIKNRYDSVHKRSFRIIYHPDSIKELSGPLSFDSKLTTLQKVEDTIDPDLRDPVSFSVDLDNSVLFTGQHADGTVMIRNPTRKTIRKVHLTLKGTEHVRTTTMKEIEIGGLTFERNVPVRKRKVIDKEKFVIDVDLDSEVIEVPFRITAPKGGRTSFKGVFSKYEWHLECRVNVALGSDARGKTLVAVYRWS